MPADVVDPDSGKHECPYPHCARRIQPYMLACRPHWFTVTPATRRRVWDAWNSGSSDHSAAVVQACEEMKAHAAARGR